MIIRHAAQIGDPVIRAKAKPVKAFPSRQTDALVRNLVDSMRFHELVGMAAPQIGVGFRVFVTEIRKTRTRKPRQADPVRVFINPKIVSRSKKQSLGIEGCGSVAHSELFAQVKRPGSVTVTAYDEKGKKFTLRANGLLARVIQHEFDHLEGKVFLDRLPDMRGLMDRENI